MKYTIKMHHRDITDTQLLSDLCKTAKKLGKNYIGSEAYNKYGKYSRSIMCNRFGSWNRALKKAGLEVKYIRCITNDELLRELKRVWDKLGRQPLSYEIHKPLCKYDDLTYKRHFGSWRLALIAFSKTLKNCKLQSSGKCRRIRNKKKRTDRGITKTLRFDVMLRDLYKCQLCHASPAKDPTVKLCIDHIIPLSKGGDSTMDNLWTLCVPCNLGKAAKLLSKKQMAIINKRMKK